MSDENFYIVMVCCTVVALIHLPDIIRAAGRFLWWVMEWTALLVVTAYICIRGLLP